MRFRKGGKSDVNCTFGFTILEECQDIQGFLKIVMLRYKL